MEESVCKKIEDSAIDMIILKHLFCIQVDGSEFR